MEQVNEISKFKQRIEKSLNCCIYIVGYALILTILATIFKNTIQIDNSYFGIWGILISTVIYILNKTVKPILFSLTLPITAMTLGLFYPFINVIILNVVDIIFGNHFCIRGIVMSFLIAILISIMNILMDQIIIKPILKGERI